MTGFFLLVKLSICAVVVSTVRAIWQYGNMMYQERMETIGRMQLDVEATKIDGLIAIELTKCAISNPNAADILMKRIYHWNSGRVGRARHEFLCMTGELAETQPEAANEPPAQ